MNGWSFDATIRIPVSIDLSTATAARLVVKFLDTNEQLGDPESFYDYSNGFEDVAIVTAADATYLDQLAPGREEAPLVLASPGTTATTSRLYYPSSDQFYIAAYEDQFPNRGDYDFNDLVVAYRVHYELGSSGNAVSVGGEGYLVARGGGFDSDWHLRLAHLILWDGGNNDFPFFVSDLQIVVADPHRPGHELAYHPGETNARLAGVFVINKVDTANPENVLKVRENLRKVNSKAKIVEAVSPLFVDDPAAIQGKRVLVMEDGPTLTHGEMAYGAGLVAARRLGAAQIVDPRPFAVRTIAETFQKYPATGPILPAMGYGNAQMRDLEETINHSNVDLVISATPIDLTRIVKINKPIHRVRYELQEIGQPTLEDILREKFGK